MPTVTRKPAHSEITLQNGEKFEVVENFATIMRHQKEALANEEPLMDLMGPDMKRVAFDPIEIISVNELRRPTRNYGKSNGKVEKPKKRTTAKKPATSRLAQRRTAKKTKTGSARTRRRVTA